MVATTVELDITFPGGTRVSAGGEACSPAEADGGPVMEPPASPGPRAWGAPLRSVLVAVGTSAGIYVLGFCQARNLPADHIRLHETALLDPETSSISRIDIDVVVPHDFPARYREQLVRVADGQAVRRALQAAPEICVRTRVQEAA